MKNCITWDKLNLSKKWLLHVLLSVDRFIKWSVASSAQKPIPTSAVKILQQYMNINAVSKFIGTDRGEPSTGQVSGFEGRN